MTSRPARRIFALLGLIPFIHAAEPATPAVAPGAYPLETYAVVGSSFAQSTRLADLDWTEEQFNAFLEGVRATLRGKPHPLDERARALLEETGRRLQQRAAPETLAPQEFFADPARLEAYMKDMTKNFKLQRADSGLAFGLMPRGGGARPGPDDTVVVSYHAVAADAKTELPSLAVKQQRVRVAELLPGLAEVVQMMTVGSATMVILPPDLSYGAGEWPPGVVRGTPLIYTLVLHEVISPP